MYEEEREGGRKGVVVVHVHVMVNGAHACKAGRV